MTKVPTDIEIAQAAKLRPIGEVAAESASIEPIDIRLSRPGERSVTVEATTHSQRETADV